MIDAQSLETLTITASTSGTIALGDVGTTNAAEALERVDITSEGANITIGTIDAVGATISQFNITAGADSTITIDGGASGIDAQDISEMTITIEQDATVDIEDSDLTVHGETLTVSGEGTLVALTFSDESFARMNFSGLTGSAADVNIASTAGNVSYSGTANADDVVGGTGRLTAEFGAGADTVDMATSDGALTADMGAGIDAVTLNDSGSDADVVQMGGTLVSAITGSISAQADAIAAIDNITNFLSNDDAIAFTATSPAGTAANYAEADGVAVATFTAALAAADAALNGTVLYYMLYDFDDLEDGILFYDNDGDGSANLAIYVVGIDTAAKFDQGDIAVGADIIA
jgi:hypothetical protein